MSRDGKTVDFKINTTIRDLYDYVQTRPRPEDVADRILEVLGASVDARAKAALETAAQRSWRRLGYAYGSMAADFFRPSSKVDKQICVASTLLGVEQPSGANASDPAAVRAFVERVSPLIHRAYGDQKRLTKAERHARGLFKCQRWYNKCFRILCRIERKMTKLDHEQRKYLFTRVGKSGLAVEIPYDDFAADLPTACAVAYLSARMSLRSTFTNTSQVRAYDEIADELIRFAEAQGGIRWDVIAYVLPTDRVLRHLSDDAKGRLLGRYWSLLCGMADMLHESFRETPFDPKTMIVRRGNDSSTWNQVAGGWNRARESYVSVLHAMGMSSVLDSVCLGKVMRLMAADVAQWHQASGGDVHPDTKVFAALPFPWDVVHGRESCTRGMVEDACRNAGVKPEAWTGASEKDAAAARFTPTPELVHGVSVSSPELALVLRKAGVFSGQFAKPLDVEVHVVRDEHGAALHVVESTTTEKRV